MQQLVEDVQEDYFKDDIPDFNVGDTIQVHVIISEGGAKRTQRFEGYVTARKGDGLDETFTVRKMVQGEGVERVFPLHSPKIDRIEKVQSGRVRRSKLYYLSEQKGKAADIREDLDKGEQQEETSSEEVQQETDATEASAEDQTEEDADDATEEETEDSDDEAASETEEEDEASDQDEETDDSKE
jgi:large subunit ribosomal protein L19